MFTVDGRLDGEPYRAMVQPDRSGIQQGAYGAVTGSANIVRYLVGRQGDYYAATPTGPFGQLDCHSPESVFGALLAWTTVDKVHGIAPDVLGGMPQKGTVY